MAVVGFESVPSMGDAGYVERARRALSFARYSRAYMIPSAERRYNGATFPYRDELAAFGARVVGYAFRVDQRPPEVVEEAGGFWPIHTHDAADAVPWGPQSFNMDLHLAGYGYDAFVSTSRSARVVDALAMPQSKTRAGAAHDFAWPYVYAVRVLGGVEPRNDLTLLNRDSFTGEAEIAVPGGIDWTNVVGYRVRRRVGLLGAGRPGPGDAAIYLRPELARTDPEAYRQIVVALS